MRAFQLKCQGDQSRLREQVCISSRPRGLGLKSYLLGTAQSVAAYYPATAEIHLKEREPGRQLTDFLSNTLWCFMVNRQTRSVVEALCGDHDVEYLPFRLYDHQGNALSDDYCIIHPLRVRDVVDRDASEISFEDDDPEGEILSVDDYVFKSRSAENLPPLFRVPEYSYDIFMSETLARALHQARISNPFLHEVRFSERD